MRGGTALAHVQATIKGGGSHFIETFRKVLLESSTPEELSQLEAFNKNVPGANFQNLLEIMASTKSQVDILAKQPMLECNLFVTQHTRLDLGIQPVDPVLAFDVSGHDAANTAPAQSVLTRFREDVEAYAMQANTVPVFKLGQLTDKIVMQYFSADESASAAAEAVLRDVCSRSKMLMKKLRHLQESDTAMVGDIVPLLEIVANFVSYEIIADSALTRATKTRYLLNRFSGQNSFVWVEFLFGVLLSTQGEKDLLKLNPYLSAEVIQSLLSIVSLVMLRANRLGQTNRCIGTLISLESLLDKIVQIPFKDRARKGSVLAPKLIQSSEDLSKMITMERYYMKKSSTAATNNNSIASAVSYDFDPRYLVFEFVWNIQLRQKQVDIVNDFRESLASDKSKVKQMIMGE